MNRTFTLIDEITRECRRFNTVATQLTLLLVPPSEWDERDPVSYFMASVTNLCEHALQNSDDSDMVYISIQ